MTLAARPAAEPLPGFKDMKPQVFAGLYPVEANEYEALRDALDKLKLNDASLHYEPEVSVALGFGFRCGFLGLLHMDIVQERLEREYDMDLITTAPTVVYQVLLRDGTVLEIENPSKLPDASRVEEIREPIITATILLPQDYVGPVMTLCTEKRGVQKNMQYLGRQVMLTYELPLAEVVMDFFDKLKSVSRGYASLDYEFREFRSADVVKLDILINAERVDALSVMVHRSVATYRGREVAAKMRKLIPRQMFDVAVQASIGANIIARETIKAMRKNVLAKCYGGDITRKKKLLEKQKAGKKRMKRSAASRSRRRRSSRSSRSARSDGAARAPGGRPCRATTTTSPTTMNFALILFLATVVTGAVALADRLVFARQRAPDAREPWWIEYPKSFFPVLLIVFLLRSFVTEPFKIPSSSMRPTLVVGDFILVNKFAYGLRLPIIEHKIVPIGESEARRRGRVPVPGQPVAGLHQARRRRRRRRGGLPRQEAHGERQAAAAGARRHLQLRRGPALRDDRTAARDRRQRLRHQAVLDRREPPGAARLPAERAAVSRSAELRLQ